MKITLSREALENIDNKTIKDFLAKNSRNKIFRLDTGDKDPKDFGITDNSYRTERVTDKGYIALPYSAYHTPTYTRSAILKLFENFPDIQIPNILPPLNKANKAPKCTIKILGGTTR